MIERTGRCNRFAKMSLFMMSLGPEQLKRRRTPTLRVTAWVGPSGAAALTEVGSYVSESVGLPKA
jgi:hypothetical protein